MSLKFPKHPLAKFSDAFLVSTEGHIKELLALTVGDPGVLLWLLKEEIF